MLSLGGKQSVSNSLPEGHNRRLGINLDLGGDDLDRKFDEVAGERLVNTDYVGRSPLGLQTASSKRRNYSNFIQIVLEPLGEWFVKIGFLHLNPGRRDLLSTAHNDGIVT